MRQVKSVEDMMLQLILQGDSITLLHLTLCFFSSSCSTSLCCTMLHPSSLCCISSCFTNHDSTHHCTVTCIIVAHIMLLHLPILHHLVVPYHLAALTSATSYYTSLHPSCSISFIMVVLYFAIASHNMLDFTLSLCPLLCCNISHHSAPYHNVVTSHTIVPS